jgi:hypothetical protein
MADDLAGTLLPALEIAAFARAADGSFTSIAPVPSWFRPLIADTTFPFLGHILEEAAGFWTSGAEGFREFGPCAEVDEAGVEYHYKVIAASGGGAQFLLFQRDPAADRLREVLQKAREHTLDARASPPALRNEALQAADAIRDGIARLRLHSVSADDNAVIEEIMSLCDRLRRAAAAAALPPRA